MSEIPPPERPPEPLAFDAQRDRVAAARGNTRSGDISGTIPPTRDLQRELIGQTVGGRYRIKGVLGEGGMGTVYDAEHLGLSRQVAIKVLSPAQAKKKVAVKRFQQEARAAGAIGHPNICEVYDLGLLDDGSPYLVMEKLVGQTLAERISKEGGLPFEDVVEVVSQVLSGLVAAHEKGIVHRDIKPENIFLARRVGCPPIIKLLDFGVSKMMPEFQTGDDALDLTRTGMVMGTPYYMSPEQARGERNLDGRVDVYACGVVMYEALAGRRPFLAPNYNALLLAIINTTPRSIRELRPATPPTLEAIMKRAMERNRADRYASAKEMLRDLTPPPAHLAEHGGGARVPAPPTAEERKRAPVLGGGRARPEPVVAAPRDDDTRIERGSRARAPHDQASMASRAHARAYHGHEPVDRPDGPSATLRSRMTEGSSVERDRATRIESRAKVGPSPFDTRAPEASLPPLRGALLDSDDSIDIPIHVTVPVDDEIDIPLDEEDPTEIFRPGRHPMPRLPAQGPRPRPSLDARAPAPVAPQPSRPPAADDWDGVTVVKRPDMLPPERPPAGFAAQARSSSRPPPSRRRPFNPEETMKLDGSDLEIIDPRPRRR